MTRKQVTDAQVDAANEIYRVAREGADQEIAKLKEEIVAVRVESEAIGVIKKIDYDIAHNEFLKLMVLYRIKQKKDYKAGGLTWVQFCEVIGTPQRTADRLIEEMRPLFEKFSANLADFCGMPLNKIRYLGQAISANLADFEDGCLVYGDERIPLTPEHRDDIQALVEKLDEDRRQALEEAKGQKKADERVLGQKQKKLNDQEREIAVLKNKLEARAAAKGLSAEEDDILERIETLGVELNGYCLSIENVSEALLEEPFPNAVAAFITLLDNAKMRLSAFRESAADVAPAGMIEDGWTPPVKK